MRAIWFLANFVILAAIGASSFETFEGLIPSHDGCPLDHFMCDDGECILLAQHCDEKDDCSDRSDEKNCELDFCRGPQFFECGNGNCIDGDMVCNDVRDCLDGSDEDEQLCHTQHQEHHINYPECDNATQFTCDDKMCIPWAWVCDGEPNCLDDSDEKTSLCQKHHCSREEFQCRDGHCIEEDFKCDGSPDCKDGSDEENCPVGVYSMDDECTLDNERFPCHDRTLCIDISALCNNKRDCFDGSDEGGLCHEKIDCNGKANCSIEQCFQSPSGQICLCSKGYKHDNGVCVDIDECKEFGICDQKCSNLVGGFRCSCDPGYALQKDGHTCRAEGGKEPLIYFSLGREIRVRFLKSGMYHAVARNLSQAIGVEVQGHHVYWTNIYEGDEMIVRAQQLGAERMPIVTAGLREPEDLAVDWVTGNIYFTDSGMKMIGVCCADASHCAVLHNRDINNPRGIALLPYEGYMYWSDWGNRSVIARSGMDGSDVFEFVSENLGWPNGITIDHGNQRLYWVDAKMTTIESIRLDGTDRRKVLERAVVHPYSIAVFEDTIYWSDWDSLKIESANKFTGKNRKTVVQDKNRIYGIKVYHPAMHDIDQINYCFGAPCSDLCLLAPERVDLRSSPSPAGNSRRYSCACPDGKQLAANNHSCIETEKKQELVIGNRDRLLSYQHKQLGRVHIEELPLDQGNAMIGDISALQYNSQDGSLIVGDSYNRKMSSVDLKTLQARDIVTTGVGRIEGIAFDNLGSNIYWTDSELGKVEVINTINHHRKTIMNHLQGDIPRGIAVIPSEGIMYVSLTSPTTAHIDKLSMASGDVMSRTHIFEENLRGPFIPLFYDGMLHRMYWADSGTRRIEHTNWNGEERHTYSELNSSPISVTSVGTDIFWSTPGFKNVYYANKLEFKGSKVLDLSNLVYSNSKIFITAVTGLDSQRNHPCAVDNGNCSHICLVSPKKDIMRECACPDGMYLKEGGRECSVREACERGEFECGESSVAGIVRHCIAAKKKCDGNKDCPMGEDEDRSLCGLKDFSKLHCLPGQFACLDGSRCIPDALLCNWHADCDDHSDETLGCDSSRAPEDGRAQPNIPEVCEFRCSTSNECVSEAQRCDLQPDCSDGSDELGCDAHLCDKTAQFRCRSGACIAAELECNGEMDCRDASDEHAKCNHVRTCSPNQITCNNGQCIDKELKCNGRNDCDDASDEQSCPQRPIAHIPVFANTGASSPECDTRFEFECERGHCIPSSARCNHTSECSNGRDELNCMGCHHDQFQCKNERCIYHTWVCDKKNDCGDNSDEEEALCKTRKGNADQSVATKSDTRCFGSFRCASDASECIHTDKVCNNEKDCSDGSDEGGMCDKGCESAGCSDTCQRTPHGPKCTCPQGFELSGDAKTCVDIDECATEEYCSQYCSNTPGAFRCSCKAPEYVLRENGMSCKAKGGEMQFIYSVYNEIRTMSGWHSYLGIVHSDPDYRARVAGLTADVARKHVYWTTTTNDSVFQISMDNRRMIRSAHIIRPSRLAIDWITGNVYVVEAATQITAVNFEKRTHARLYKSDPAKDIEALAVDPVTRTMFWSERLAHKIQFSAIYRADTSGSGLLEIVSTNLKQVSDIFVDSFHAHIYWVDSQTRKVERASFDGSNRQEVFTSPAVPTDITLFEDYMYVLVQADSASENIDMIETGNVWRCGLYGAAYQKCELFRIHPKHFTVPYHFEIMHPGLQLKGHNDCRNSTDCQSAGGMCLLRNHKLRPSAVCVCADGTRMRRNSICEASSATIFDYDDVTYLTSNSPVQTSSLGSAFWMFLAFIFVVVPVVGILWFVYRGGPPSVPLSPPQWMPGFCARRFPFHTIRFNSKFGNLDADDTIPAYSDFQFHPCQLNPGEHQYENPIAAMQAEQNSGAAITIKTMNEIDIQMGEEKNGWMAGGGEGGDDSDSSTVEMPEVKLLNL
uniref:Vitellogenin receptor n=1 Tax=Nilaparvata lugens TaxID=108931 RepID=D5KXW4_NILLU|nr:vitellogenin receptor [Nilaparvata lugens]